MTAFEGLSLPCGLVGFDSLLAKPDGFDNPSGFGDDNMRFGWVAWCTLWFVVTGHTSPR